MGVIIFYFFKLKFFNDFLELIYIFMGFLMPKSPRKS